MRLTFEEAYAILGVSADVTDDELKAAYKRMALQYHPDKNNSPDATDKFQQIGAAYQKLQARNQDDDEEWMDEDRYDNDFFMNLFRHVFEQEILRQMQRGNYSSFGSSRRGNSYRGNHNSAYYSPSAYAPSGYYDNDDDYDDYEDEEEEEVPLSAEEIARQQAERIRRKQEQARQHAEREQERIAKDQERRAKVQAKLNAEHAAQQEKMREQKLRFEEEQRVKAAQESERKWQQEQLEAEQRERILKKNEEEQRARSTAYDCAAKGELAKLRYLFENHHVKVDGWENLGQHTRLKKTFVEETLMHTAAREGRIDIILFLAGQGANASAMNGTGQEPIHVAADHGHVDAVCALIDQCHAKVDSKTLDLYRTPLHLAAIRGFDDVVAALLQRGARVSLKDIFGNDTLQCATSVKPDTPVKRTGDTMRTKQLLQSHQDAADGKRATEPARPSSAQEAEAAAAAAQKKLDEEYRRRQEAKLRREQELESREQEVFEQLLEAHGKPATVETPKPKKQTSSSPAKNKPQSKAAQPSKPSVNGQKQSTAHQAPAKPQAPAAQPPQRNTAASTSSQPSYTSQQHQPPAQSSQPYQPSPPFMSNTQRTLGTETFDRLVATLMDMGFPFDESRLAVMAAGNNVDRALEILITSGVSLSVPSPASPPPQQTWYEAPQHTRPPPAQDDHLFEEYDPAMFERDNEYEYDDDIGVVFAPSAVPASVRTELAHHAAYAPASPSRTTMQPSGSFAPPAPSASSSLSRPRVRAPIVAQATRPAQPVVPVATAMPPAQPAVTTTGPRRPVRPMVIPDLSVGQAYKPILATPVQQPPKAAADQSWKMTPIAPPATATQSAAKPAATSAPAPTSSVAPSAPSKPSATSTTTATKTPSATNTAKETPRTPGAKARQANNNVEFLEKTKNMPADGRRAAPVKKSNTICRYYALGKCNRGDECPFAHEGPVQHSSASTTASPSKSPSNGNRSTPRAESKLDVMNIPIPIMPAAPIKRHGKASADLNSKYNPGIANVKPPLARFFVIKSFFEKNILSAITRGLWSSSQRGNQTLTENLEQLRSQAAALQLDHAPLYLFASGNQSACFQGVAEMLGPPELLAPGEEHVFPATPYWKGTVQFPIKWLVVKDIPFQALVHICLPNNGMQPVTVSRDVQEVPYQQGLQMLQIFKTFPHNSSILDDKEYLLQTKPASQEADDDGKEQDYEDDDGDEDDDDDDDDENNDTVD